MANFFNINVVELGLFFVGIGYVVTFYLKGGNQAFSEVITALKEQADLNGRRIIELTHEVGELTGKLKEKEDRIKILEALVQGRSPEQEQYMEDMRTFTAGVAKYMNESTEMAKVNTATLGEMSIFMKNLNKSNVI